MIAILTNRDFLAVFCVVVICWTIYNVAELFAKRNK